MEHLLLRLAGRQMHCGEHCRSLDEDIHMIFFPLMIFFLLTLTTPVIAQTVNEAPGGGFEALSVTRTGYLVADIQSGDPERVQSALRTLPHLQDNQANAVIEATLSADLSHEDKLLALEEAARRGKQLGQDMFALALRNGDHALKREVLERVSAFSRDFAIPILELAMIDESPQIRLGAMDAAGRMDEKSRHQILVVAANDEDAVVRTQAAMDAATLPRDQAWNVLKKLVRDPSPTVAARARASAHAVGIDPAKVSPDT